MSSSVSHWTIILSPGDIAWLAVIFVALVCAIIERFTRKGKS